MELFYFADSERLPDDVIRELQDQMNCNLDDSENNEDWLNATDWPEHVSIVDADTLMMYELNNPY